MKDAIDAACGSIAPNWPLDRMIAVNPYWGMVDNSFETTHRRLASLGGSSLFMPLSYYAEQWHKGEITEEDLQAAIDEQGESLTPSALVAALERRFPQRYSAPLLSDLFDSRRDLSHEPAWCDTITHQVSQFCGAWFDRDQADWRPEDDASLFSGWREVMLFGHSVELLMQSPWIAERVRQLPEQPLELIEHALARLDVDRSDWQPFLHAVLLRISGWASWCAYRRWLANQQGADDDAIVELLAIRLAWECLLDDGNRGEASLLKQWHSRWERHFLTLDDVAVQTHSLWQRAMEMGYQRRLAKALAEAPGTPMTARPTAQAVFCIDVRSEVFRRHLEAAEDIETLGFAGFFGLPIDYTPLGTQATRPQLPGLLAPALSVTESSGDAAKDKQTAAAHQRRLARNSTWRPFASMPGSAFSLVETLGLGYLGKLIKRSKPHTRGGLPEQKLLKPSAGAKPQLSGIDLATQIGLAARVLGGMNLTERVAPLVLLIGHGSHSENNPHKAGLDCGACCGQTGEVNARALANLLNNPQVREGLIAEGINLPEDTCFIAGLHNTTTEEVGLFDTDLENESAQKLAYVRLQLAAAGKQARRERAVSLGLEKLADDPEALLKKVRQRSNDWAQTRPEWGLGNNAAFIIGPRWRSRGADLQGRVFLHEYDPQGDTEGALLEQIMTAPMVVTHWINMQYYASTVDNRRYGAGNKTLHNVVGGRIGVFEGNGGDLRIGLAMQSLHDGKNWRHQPLRLSVVIDAPRERIQAVIDKHEVVARLVNNGWLYLMRFGDNGLEPVNQAKTKA
ncbi:YbcC family protein [Marinobacterium sp. YM272]|uniref:YbcC family protein n=1 Tax=Marinobacterium sp. YM272 TaxID=3421654 RepID=UPI003D7FC4C0